MNNKTWTVTLEEDPDTGELILPFPPEMLEESDWRTGDTLNFIVQDDESIILENLSWKERHRGLICS
jgi:bifunctional DNA-binding transcriptional regulator/antitoxin component of YhaV-PrlF toxin-antitoxin module